jgi:nitrile hydratase accessory protein
MAVALHDHRFYGWEEFQRQLIAQIAQAEARGEDSRYYERWLASFERLLEDKGLVTPEELQDRTEAFEFGERDEVY